MMRNGIDVSKHQGSIEWTKVKASGVDFAILRAGLGKLASQKDVQFEANYNGCQSAGIPCGVYWYSYATTPAEAIQEADACLEVIKGKQLAYPVYFDIEEKNQFKLGKDACSAIAKAFLERVEGAGYWVGIYSSKAQLEAYISEEIRSRYAVWVAHINVSKTNYKGDFGMWQKSWTGTVSGISADVDMDECYVDYPALIQEKGLNGFSAAPAPTPEPEPEKSVAELAQEVLDGKWGNAPDRKSALEAAGYDYDAVQAEVNKLVSAPQKTYTVSLGDTLTKIAKQCGTTVQAILDANKATYPAITADFIKVGWVLKV